MAEKKKVIPKKIMGSVMSVLKEGAAIAVDKAADGKELVGDKAEEAKHRFDVYRFRPIFDDALTDMQQNMPQLIRIIDDDKMKGIDACKDAIGFRKTINGMDVMGLYPDALSLSGITFFPNDEEPLYCKDPFRDDLYVSLDEYYAHLKEARVNEIETVAQALGAKYLKVEYKVEKSSVFSKDAKAKVKAKPKGVVDVQVDAQHHSNKKEYSKIDVLAEVRFDGNNAPVAPEIKYLKGFNAIDTLIKMRVDPESQNKIKSKTYHVGCKQLMGLKQNDAVKIDGAIKKMKIQSSSSLTVESMAEIESMTTLEFEIEF